jgi:hypothetical protein
MSQNPEPQKKNIDNFFSSPKKISGVKRQMTHMGKKLKPTSQSKDLFSFKWKEQLESKWKKWIKNRKVILWKIFK